MKISSCDCILKTVSISVPLCGGCLTQAESRIGSGGQPSFHHAYELHTSRLKSSRHSNCVPVKEPFLNRCRRFVERTEFVSHNGLTSFHYAVEGTAVLSWAAETCNLFQKGSAMISLCWCWIPAYASVRRSMVGWTRRRKPLQSPPSHP